MTRFSRPRPGRTRCGYSLVEMIVVISISAVATGSSVFCISTMLKGERTTAAAVQESQVIARLRLMWNEDVHLTKEWNVSSADQNSRPQCDLTLQDGRKVRYRESDRGLLRQFQKNGGSEQQDLFQFPPGTEVQFQQVEEPRLARLRVIRPAVESSVAMGGSAAASLKVLGKVVMTFDAVLGREARLLEQLQTQPEAK